MSNQVVLLPILYSGVIIATAKVDPQFSSLQSLRWGCRFTKKFIRRCNNRPDIMIAELKELPFDRHNIYPRACIQENLWVNLVHFVLRPEIMNLAERKPVGFSTQVRELQKGIGRIVYLNSDRTDCRLSNLREVKQNVQQIEIPPEREPSSSEDNGGDTDIPWAE